jgi:hypothetical protein
LWYEKLRSFLKGIGYEQSETDPYVFRKISGNQAFLLIVNVDDVLIFATDDELRRLEKLFTEEFWWIMLEVGGVHSYMLTSLQLQMKQFELKMSKHQNYHGQLNPDGNYQNYHDNLNPDGN